MEKKEKKKLIEERNFNNDNGWLNGPASLQMINENDNIQTNIDSNQELRGKMLRVPDHHVRHHSLSLPLSRESFDFSDKKRYRRRSAFPQEKDYNNKDCIIS